ncbi:MAG: hypothetical protein ACD_75C01360G0004 [uncultured bacterium]|nr:MAG: hypothetical protein ACD_75C01360G0004 [uncultured bacterium]
MINLPIKLVILMLAAISAGVLWQQTRLAALALIRLDPLPETRTMVAEERYAEASDYLGFFMEYEYVNQNSEAQALYRDISSKRRNWRYQIDKLGEGLLTGTSDEIIGKAAGVTTDFFVIGDLRDLTKQGVHLAKGEEVDEVLVALATLGVVASGAQIVSGAGTVASGGAASPAVAGTTVAKSGLIALKTAQKLGKLPPWLGKAMVQSVKAIKETKSLSSLTGILGDVNTLAKTRGGFNLMSKAKDAASLKRMATFAETFGSNSATLYRIGGDLTVKVAQQAGKLGKDTIQLAATFGQRGLRVLDRVGAVTFVKISSRASKMVHKGDIFYLLAWLLLMLPTWVLYMIVALGAAILVPWRRFSRLGKEMRPIHNLPIVDQSLPGN